MTRSFRFAKLASCLFIALLALTGCQDNVTAPSPSADDGPAPSATQNVQTQNGDGCVPTGTGLTAKVVNQDVIGQTIDVGNCDVGAFFNENGLVKNATFKQTETNPDYDSNFQYLVRADGARVKVKGSEFEVDEGYEVTKNDIVHIGLRSGAHGIVTGNELTGPRRTGILLNDEGTSGVVRKNTVEGVGPRPGPISTGIQVGFGATGTVKGNEVRDHWKAGPLPFCSTGIGVPFGSNVTIKGNEVTGNDCGITLLGGQNNVAGHNTIEVSNDEANPKLPVGFAAGVLVAGSNNKVLQNGISGAQSAAAGIWILSQFQGRTIASRNNKLIRNRITGFVDKIRDGGTETKLPPPFDPSE